MKKILIYNDVGAEGVDILNFEISDYFLKNGMKIEYANSFDILENGILNKDIYAFFMPGGAANPYEDKLGKKGNTLIKSYVKNGGMYLGICAGAYYACENTIFEKNLEDLEVIKKYGLNLIKADAIGSLYKELNITPYSKDFKSVAVVDIEWMENKIKKFAAYYHGGPYFKLKCGAGHKILARYKNIKNKPPAIVARKVGKGFVIVSGVHFEYDLTNLIEKLDVIIDKDYVPRYSKEEIIKKEQFRKALFMKIADFVKQN